MLGQQSLWMDESSVFEAWGNSIKQTWLNRHGLQPQNAPLFPILISFLNGFLGLENFLSYRFFYPLFLEGVSLFVLYKVSVFYFSDRNKRFIFLLLICISSFHIQYSQLVRFYILLFLFFYLHFFLCLRWFKGR